MSVTTPRSQIAADDLARHVEHLAGAIGERHVFRPEALHAARRYIAGQWQALGYEVAEQVFDAMGVQCANLETTRTGNERPEEIILVGAHYDTVQGSPGADDNASGIAALLEIGRCIADTVPGRTLRLVAFVNEEAPFFFSGTMGSMVYARAARKRGDDIRLMMSLEMLGYYDDRPGSQGYPPLLRYFYPDRGNFIGFVSNLRSRGMLNRSVRAFREHSNFPCESLAAPPVVPGIALSDHLSFWREGYPALMITDTSFYRYRYYHTAADTPEKLDYDAMAEVSSGLVGMLCSLAKD